MLEVNVVYNEQGSQKNGYYGTLLRLTFAGRHGGKQRKMVYEFEDREAQQVFTTLGEGFEEVIEKGQKKEA